MRDALEISKAREREIQIRQAFSQVEHLASRLPPWPIAVRGIPNGMLRSALFSAIGRGSRRYLKNELIVAVDGIQIRYTGEQLDQGDLDVYESILHFLHLQPLGLHCRISAYALLKIMRKTDTGSNRRILHTRITRLRANAVEIAQGGHIYIGGLVDEAYRDDTTHEWIIALNRKLNALYAKDQFTQVDWVMRQNLDGHQLAQWLHGFYSSHARPYAYSVKKLKELCGSECERIDHFRQQLRKALEAISTASKSCNEGFSFSYQILGDLVHIQRTGTRSQQRHLAKKGIANVGMNYRRSSGGSIYDR